MNRWKRLVIEVRADVAAARDRDPAAQEVSSLEILLSWGGFAANITIIHWGGYIGVVTAAVAWYASAGLVIRGMRGGRDLLPLGKPFGGM